MTRLEAANLIRFQLIAYTGEPEKRVRKVGKPKGFQGAMTIKKSSFGRGVGQVGSNSLGEHQCPREVAGL